MGNCCNFHFTFWWNPTMTLEITGIRNIGCAEKGALGIVSEIFIATEPKLSLFIPYRDIPSKSLKFWEQVTVSSVSRT